MTRMDMFNLTVEIIIAYAVIRVILEGLTSKKVEGYVEDDK